MTTLHEKEKPFTSGEEEQFEQLIESTPTVIPIADINPKAQIAVPIGRQVPLVGIGSLDLLFLDDTGSLLIVECKLVQNPEQRREVVAQLHEYASFITSRWNASRILEIADEHAKQTGLISWLHLFKNAYKMAKISQDAQIEEKTIKRRIERNHLRGPILIVAANRFEERALVLVDYLRRNKFEI